MTRTHRTYVIAAAVAAIVAATNASQGAYFSQSWGWVALAFLVPTTVLLILDRVEVPGRLRVAFASLVVALGVWIALSSIWSISTAASIREAERMLVYVALAFAVALVLRRGDGAGVLAGIVLGVTLICGYALATRLLPDRLDTYDDPVTAYRLAEPLGYWNALGLLATLGTLVAGGLVAHSRRSVPALAAAAVIPIMVTTLYFTFSRGAWAALVVGLATAVVADPRRLRLLWVAFVVSIPAMACIAYASSLDALTQEDAPRVSAARDGHRLAVVVCVALVLSGLIAWAAREVSRRVDVSARSRRAVHLALAGLVAACAVVALIAAGGPLTAVDGLREGFSADPTAGTDLNGRVFSVAGYGRSEAFRVAWTAGRGRPVAGNGSGTFEYLWYERRSDTAIVRDAHSLYLETFAELGVVGLVLLVGALIALVLAAIRARRHRLGAAGLGALAAWSAAAAFDWHWEMVGVTLTAFLAAATGLVSAERGPRRALGTLARAATIASALALSLLATWSLVGNQALFAGREALARDEWASAREHGRRAHALLFWSAEPDLVLGDAAAGLGDRKAALRSYREATAIDPQSWVAWLRLAQVARGPERAAAYRTVRELNPLEEGLPGE